MSQEFAPGSRPEGPDCVNRISWGTPSNLANDYIAKMFIRSEDDYPADACAPYKYHTAKIDNWEVTTSMYGSLTTMNIPSCSISCASLTATGTVAANVFSGPTITALNSAIAGKKAFDIPHPTKEGYRLRHICLEDQKQASMSWNFKRIQKRLNSHHIGRDWLMNLQSQSTLLLSDHIKA